MKTQSPTIDRTSSPSDMLAGAEYWNSEAAFRAYEGKNADSDLANACDWLIRAMRAQQVVITAQQQQIDELREDCDHLARRHIPGMPLA